MDKFYIGSQQTKNIIKKKNGMISKHYKEKSMEYNKEHMYFSEKKNMITNSRKNKSLMRKSL